MELIEYQNKLKQLENKFELDKRILNSEFALSNNPYKIGDNFTDHIGSILIEKIQTVPYDKIPKCAYYGLELKKDGTPTKKLTKRTAYQRNDVKK